MAAGGAAVGGVVAAGIIPVRRRITDPVTETVLALTTPYAAFVLGEVLHTSPVMAVIVAGLAIGARRDRITTAQTLWVPKILSRPWPGSLHCFTAC